MQWLDQAEAYLQVVNENVRRPYVYCRDPDVFETLVVAGVPLQILVNPSLHATDYVHDSLRLTLVGSRAVTSVASRIIILSLRRPSRPVSRRARPVLTLNWTNRLMRMLCECRNELRQTLSNNSCRCGTGINAVSAIRCQRKVASALNDIIWRVLGTSGILTIT